MKKFKRSPGVISMQEASKFLGVFEYQPTLPSDNLFWGKLSVHELTGLSHESDL